jgi:elongation factor 2
LEGFHAGVPLKKSDYMTSYRETVCAESSMAALSKSQNKHIHLYAKASPLGDELSTAIESEMVGPLDDPNLRTRILISKYGWDAMEAKKIWCFGPDGTGANVLVDTTKGVQGLNEVKDHCVTGFQLVTKEGVCAGEQMRGVRINILDATVRKNVLGL